MTFPTTPSDPRALAFSSPAGKSQAATSGTAYSPGKYTTVSCTTAGTVTVTFADASTLVLSFPIGVFVLPFAATTLTTGTATATYGILY